MQTTPCPSCRPDHAHDSRGLHSRSSRKEDRNRLSVMSTFQFGSSCRAPFQMRKLIEVGCYSRGSEEISQPADIGHRSAWVSVSHQSKIQSWKCEVTYLAREMKEPRGGVPNGGDAPRCAANARSVVPNSSSWPSLFPVLPFAPLSSSFMLGADELFTNP